MSTPMNHPADAAAHANLLQAIQDEFDETVHKEREAKLRIKDLKKAFKLARKSVHKERMARIHAAERELASAKTEKARKAAETRVKAAQHTYHSGLKKIHSTYKPGGGSYGY